MAKTNPKLFISYSWSSLDHQKWVIDLATQLRESSVDVILDTWDLKEGHDALAFMEKMVTDPKIKKVVLICDREYAEKADGRSGGVGTETQIISPEVYAKEDQNKFVAILSMKDENGKPYLPTYYKSRIYIDLSDSDLYASNFEQLLRWIYDKPLHVKPELGDKPSFLSEENPISLGTTVKFRRALDAVRNNKEYADGAIEELFSTFAENLEKFRITKNDGEFDEQVISSIEHFLLFRNEIIVIFMAIARYRNTPEAIQCLLRFLESLIPYMEKPKGITRWDDWDFDNFRFLIHEIFLYSVACFLKHERFDSVSHLLRQYYYVEDNASYGKNTMLSFSVFCDNMKSLEYRNTRLKLNRLSLRADLLKQRSATSGITFNQLMQADFVLFIINSISSMKKGEYQDWYPYTLIYTEVFSGRFEIFSRAQSKEYFDKIKCLFDIQTKDDLLPLFEAFKLNTLSVPRWQFHSFNPQILMGFDNLAVLP